LTQTLRLNARYLFALLRGTDHLSHQPCTL